MHCSGEEDSGRSSCSAGSCGAAPVLLRDLHIANASDELKNRLNCVTREAATNTELRVSARPRSCVGIPKSPDERDPFPNHRPVAARRNTLQSLFDSPRKGGLTNAQSTLEISSSTRIELAPHVRQNAVSLTNVDKESGKVPYKRKPVQRAASRLYGYNDGKGQNKGCIGPEFIVRASQPVQRIDLTTSEVDKKLVTIVLLTGQRVEVVCEPNNTTAGQIFEAIVKSEKYEHNFMLGVAVLIGGDFVFLPDHYKIRKVSPEGWCSKHNNLGKSTKKTKEIRPCPTFTAFLRIKFFLPTNIAKNIQGGDWRYRVYLQLRRSTVEGQLGSSLQNLTVLAGYALHIEFGDFFYREHGSGDYFLLEHYLPEGSYSTGDVAEIKLRMKRAHESRRGIDREKSIINYIVLAQTYRDYGAHFYSAVWATRDGFCRDIWLSIAPRGVTLYSRNTCISALPKESHNGNLMNRIVLQSLAWHHIHTLHYNKKTLYIVPNSRSGLAKTSVKYKIKMDDNKSYFTFWLASLHHRLYLKLHAKQDFIDYLSDELSYPVSPVSSEGELRGECSNYQDSYNIAVRNRQRQTKRQPKKKFRIEMFSTKTNGVQLNKENEKPDTQKLLQELMSARLDESILDESINSVLSKPNCSSNEGLSSSESCSLPRRQGVKMGTRAFHGMRPSRTIAIGEKDRSLRSDGELGATQSDSDDLSVEPKQQICNVNSMKLLPNRNYKEQHYPPTDTAYVIESPKVYSSFTYNPTNDDTCLNTSLFDKLDSSSCVQGERNFVTAVLRRDVAGALGMQVAEGSDGNVYIKSITPNGPADLSKKLIAGDQIISVNGHTLLNVQYNKALSMLQAAPQRVELIVLQNIGRHCSSANKSNGKEHSQFGLESIPNLVTKTGAFEAQMSADSINDGLNEIATTEDNEIINEEALRTIHALIKLTKQNVIMRMKEKSNLNTPNKILLQKCLSENRIYDESDAGNYSSQESTPQKKSAQHFDTWRCRVQSRPKRRPLSLHIPANVELSEKFFDNYDDGDISSFNDVTVLEKASLNMVKSSLQNLGEKLIEEHASEVKNVAVPRNFGLSRKWLGPVKYPVTPCKNGGEPTGRPVKPKDHVVKKHFVYGGDSEEDQLFL